MSDVPETLPQAEQEPEAAEVRWEEGRQYTLVQLSGHTLAVDIAHTSQIMERPPITPVPNTPEFVLGVCNIRGDIYSIVDIRPLLGFPLADQEARPDPLIILLEGPRFTCGATIEGVSELLRIPDAHIVAPTTEMPFISGLYRLGQEVVLVLDVDALLESPEMTQFQ